MPPSVQRLLDRIQHIASSFQALTQRNGFLLLLTTTGQAYAINALPDSAAALAYFTLFSIFPLLLALIALFAFVVGTESALNTVISFLAASVPVARDLISSNINLAVQSRGVIGVIGVLILLWSATGIFSSLTTAINRAWGFPNDRFIVWQKLLEIGLALAVGAALILSLLATTILQFLSVVTGIAPVAAQLETSVIARVTLGVAPLIVDFLAFLVLFRVLPTRPVRLDDLWLPALIGALLFEILKNVFSWYVSTFTNYQIVFGSLAALVIFLFWIYISALIILFTVQLAATYAKMRAPAALAAPAIGGGIVMSEQTHEHMPSAEDMPSKTQPPIATESGLSTEPRQSEPTLPDTNVSMADVPQQLKSRRGPLTIALLLVVAALIALATFLNLRKVGADVTP